MLWNLNDLVLKSDTLINTIVAVFQIINLTPVNRTKQLTPAILVCNKCFIVNESSKKWSKLVRELYITFVDIELNCLLHCKKKLREKKFQNAFGGKNTFNGVAIDFQWNFFHFPDFLEQIGVMNNILNVNVTEFLWQNR